MLLLYVVFVFECNASFWFAADCSHPYSIGLEIGVLVAIVIVETVIPRNYWTDLCTRPNPLNFIIFDTQFVHFFTLRIARTQNRLVLLRVCWIYPKYWTRAVVNLNSVLDQCHLYGQFLISSLLISLLSGLLAPSNYKSWCSSRSGGHRWSPESTRA